MLDREEIWEVVSNEGISFELFKALLSLDNGGFVMSRMHIFVMQMSVV
jgi:hypothetical protein